MMNPYLHQPYIGLSDDGHPIEGIILHVGNYNKHTKQADTYAVKLYCGGSAIVKANTIMEHVSGLALVASMEKDAE